MYRWEQGPRYGMWLQSPRWLILKVAQPHRGLCEATSERDMLANELVGHIPLPESNPGNGEEPTIFEALS